MTFFPFQKKVKSNILFCSFHKLWTHWKNEVCWIFFNIASFNFCILCLYSSHSWEIHLFLFCIVFWKTFLVGLFFVKKRKKLLKHHPFFQNNIYWKQILKRLHSLNKRLTFIISEKLSLHLNQVFVSIFALFWKKRVWF